MSKQFLGFYNPLDHSYKNLLAYMHLWAKIQPTIPATREDVLGIAKDDGLTLTEEQIKTLLYWGDGRNYKKKAIK